MSEKRTSNEVFGAPPAHVPRVDVMKDDFGFEIPIEAIPLPSKGVVYSPDDPLHMQEMIEIRAMTAREEDILTSKALIKKGTVITELIKSCLMDKRIDVENMLSGDRNAVMVALRVTGYGSEYNCENDCPACGARSKQSFNLSELSIKRLQTEPVAMGANLFEFKLPVTKKTVRFKFLTGRDETDMSVLNDRKKSKGFQADNLVTTRLSYAIKDIGGISDKVKINGFIRNMPARDSLALRSHIEQQEPGIAMKVFHDCPSCFETSEVRLPMGANFFWPDTEG